jgi:cell division protein FtsQ
VRKLKILALWLSIAGYLVFVSGFVSDKYDRQICESISVKITDSLTNNFITDADVTDILLANGSRLLGYPLHTINTLELEKQLNKEAFIKNSELYKTVNGVLHAEIVQRKPIIRIINQQGKSYYLDKEGVILPVSKKYTSRVLVANGHISEPFIVVSNKSIFDTEAPVSKRNSVIYDLFEMASFIDDSDLWSAQITQVFVNTKYEYELVPRVGAHVIHLGDADEYESKFRKLEVLYRYGLNSKGWNNYEIIDLKYKNQVVCTKR